MVDQGTAFAIFFLVVFGVPLAIIFLYCLFRFRVGKEEARSTPVLSTTMHGPSLLAAPTSATHAHTPIRISIV